MSGKPSSGPAAGPGRSGLFPVGATVTVAELAEDPHPALARLRAREPVSWLPALGGWLVTRHDIAVRILRDDGLFTVDDPRFTTARVVGPSMLSLDGAAHAHHRDPFSPAFRVGAVRDRLADFVEAQAGALVAAIRPAGHAELRRSLAGPLAVAAVAQILGLRQTGPATVLAWYDAIVGAVSALAAQQPDSAVPDSAVPDSAVPDSAVPDSAVPDSAVPDSAVPDSAARAGAEAFGELSASLREAIGRPGGASLLAAVAEAGGLATAEIISDAAVLMFGGIETTEGMICNAIWHLLSHPRQLGLVRADPGLRAAAIEESLRLEPAAAVVDRYATADVRISAAAIRRGDLVTVSLAGAGRDPALFPDPDRFDVRRDNARLHLAFARGSHFCLGAHLARLEALAALGGVLDGLPGLRLDPDRPSSPRGLVFRKPPTLHVRWDEGSPSR